MKIEGVVAIVTGGGSGLGEATCESLAARGAKVVVVDIHASKAEAVASRMGGTAVVCDVADETQVAALFATVKERFGAARILVNCAGISESALVVNRKGVPNPLANFKRLIGIHLQGTYDTVRLAAADMWALPPLEDGERGVIILTASVAAQDGQIGQVIYASAKAGVNGMVLPLARDLSDLGIRVNSIMPGIFATPLMLGAKQNVLDSLSASVPFPKRLGKPDEFASLAMEMARNSYFNGQCVRLDGAIRMAPR